MLKPEKHKSGTHTASAETFARHIELMNSTTTRHRSTQLAGTWLCVVCEFCKWCDECYENAQTHTHTHVVLLSLSLALFCIYQPRDIIFPILKSDAHATVNWSQFTWQLSCVWRWRWRYLQQFHTKNFDGIFCSCEKQKQKKILSRCLGVCVGSYPSDKLY